MAQTRIDGTRPATGAAKATAKAAAKPKARAGNSHGGKVAWERFMAAKDKQQIKKEPQQFKKPACEGTGPDIQVRDKGNTLLIVNAASPRSVQITGTVRPGKRLDQAPHPKTNGVTTVTVTVKSFGTTTGTRTCTTQSQRPLTVQLGSAGPYAEVNVEGEFQRPLKLEAYGGPKLRDLKVDASRSKFTGPFPNGLRLDMQSVWGSLEYLGSATRDIVMFRTETGSAKIDTGLGNDLVDARAATGLVDAGGGKDTVYVSDSPWYSGGLGVDTLVLKPGGDPKKINADDIPPDADRWE